MAELIREFAEQKPEEPALVDEYGSVGWGDFNARVNRLIHALRDAGLETGDTFSVLSGNRREYVEAFAAASHGGWLLVPVNWHLVAEEVAYILSDSGSKALFVDERFRDLGIASINHANAPRLNAAVEFGAGGDGLEAYEEFLAGHADDEPEAQALGGPMFYTSGTTGHPKGVKSGLSQTGAPIEMMKMIGEGLTGLLQMPRNGRSLLVGPIYHSAQWAFAFLPMFVGSGIVMRHRFDPAEALALFDDEKITNVHLVPTQFIRMLRLDDSEKAGFTGKHLEIVWHGAAPCPPEVKKQMIDWWGPKIWEYYGSTEGSIVTTCNSEDWLNKPGTVGKPTATNEIRILNDDGEPVPVGEAGQIYVKNLMGTDFEYHNDKEKTEKAHLEPGVFTFGDIGYVDEDGYLFLSDRKIDMIISGGVNIYPAEIEHALVMHPSVVDAAVFGIPNDEFGEEVKAVVELTEGAVAGDELAEELEQHCRQHLAGFKVPRSFDFEDKLPRHPTGKLLKRLLRDPYWQDRGKAI